MVSRVRIKLRSCCACAAICIQPEATLLTVRCRIFPLSADWLNLTTGSDGSIEYRNITMPFPLPNKYDGKLEAPSPFYNPPSGGTRGRGNSSIRSTRSTDSGSSGSYYLWTSHCTYWFPNDALLLNSPSLMSGEFWGRGGGNPTHNDSSFSTQSTQVLQLSPHSQSQPDPAVQYKYKYVYISDRFEPYITQNTTGRCAMITSQCNTFMTNMPAYRYVWLPLEIDTTGKVSVAWADEWSLHV